MTKLLDQPEMLEPVITLGRSRAIAAGVDAREYDAITAWLGLASEWTAAFRTAGATHLADVHQAGTDNRQVTEALDAVLASGLTPRTTGLMALSLGGYDGALSLAQEPRLQAGVTIGGPSSLAWDQLPELLKTILTIRAGSRDAAVAFVAQINARPFAAEITQPLLVIDGENDIIPGYTNGADLARLAPHGEHLMVPDGDHLVGNRKWQWLSQAADYLHRNLMRE